MKYHNPQNRKMRGRGGALCIIDFFPFGGAEFCFVPQGNDAVFVSKAGANSSPEIVASSDKAPPNYASLRLLTLGLG